MRHLEALGRIWRSRELVDDFEAVVDLGGRFAGTESEAAARELLRERLRAAAQAQVTEHVFDYDGWWREGTRLALLDGPAARPLTVHSLVWSPPTPPGGLTAEVVDL